MLSLLRRSSSVAEPWSTIVFSNSFDSLEHFSLFESISLVLYSFSISLAKEKPIFPPPTTITLE